MDGVESEVEVVQRTDLAEVGGFVAPGDCALLAHVDFVLENDFQELVVWEPVGFGFLEAQLQSAKQSREAQGVSILFEGVVRHGWLSGGLLADEVGVGLQIADQRVILGEGEVALFAGFAEETLDVFEPPDAGLQGLLTSGVDGGGRVLFSQIAKSHDGSKRLGSSPINAGLRPLAAAFAEQRRALHPPPAGGEHRSAHPGDAQNAAELSGFQARVDLHLLHAVVENAYAAALPSHPHLPADILRGRFVKGSLNLHEAVPAHVAPGLLVARKKRAWQRLQMGAFLLEACGHLFAGRAVNAFVGDVLFPVSEKKVLLGQRLETSPFERVAPNVGHSALHLPLVLRHPRTAGHDVDVVMAAKVCQLRVDLRIKPIGLEHRRLQIIAD